MRTLQHKVVFFPSNKTSYRSDPKERSGPEEPPGLSKAVIRQSASSGWIYQTRKVVSLLWPKVGLGCSNSTVALRYIVSGMFSFGTSASRNLLFIGPSIIPPGIAAWGHHGTRTKSRGVGVRKQSGTTFARTGKYYSRSVASFFWASDEAVTWKTSECDGKQHQVFGKNIWRAVSRTANRSEALRTCRMNASCDVARRPPPSRKGPKHWHDVVYH